MPYREAPAAVAHRKFRGVLAVGSALVAGLLVYCVTMLIALGLSSPSPRLVALGCALLSGAFAFAVDYRSGAKPAVAILGGRFVVEGMFPALDVAVTEVEELSCETERFLGAAWSTLRVTVRGSSGSVRRETLRYLDDATTIVLAFERVRAAERDAPLLDHE